jgi:hypothetical protein
MIFTVPLEKHIHTINFSTNTSLNDISAVHVKSDQSIHFTGTIMHPVSNLEKVSTVQRKRLGITCTRRWKLFRMSSVPL